MNWGNRLLITFLVFGAGISFLVYRSMHTNFELVDKDYYKNELRYQDVIDGTNRANALSTVADFEQTTEGLVLQLPSEMKGQPISGTLLFYCDYDAARDRNFSLHVDAAARQVINKEEILPGNYLAKISWNADGKNYYTEKKVRIN